MSFRRIGMSNLNLIESGQLKSYKRRYRATRWACEPLERRWMLSTDTWMTNGGGDWANGANWSDNAPPTAGEDVVIDVPGQNAIITYMGGAALNFSGNIVNNELLEIGGGGVNWTSGTLDGSGIIQFSNQLTIS